MRALVTGAKGMLGCDLLLQLAERGHDAVGTSREELNIADPQAVARVSERDFGQIDCVFNCAAYTAVDRAETEEREATEVNGFGVSYLGRACQMAGAKLVHFSTDFVFDGEAVSPYREDDEVNPLSAYGRSKLMGETALAGQPHAYVLRTSWLFGPHGHCFPKAMLNAHLAGKSLRVVADQTGCPTYTPDLARVAVELAELDPMPGLYHATGPTVTTWHGLAIQALTVCTGKSPEIEAIGTEDWPTPARRPRYSVLCTDRLLRLGIQPMRPLGDALEDFCAQIHNSG